ncbi:MAG: GvpL/GvpF family gas vesicle protein [Anaerotignum sp.]|nr:GvpL/GvpF family gas vesicle protein [Anaerotignum sp.]
MAYERISTKPDEFEENKIGIYIYCIMQEGAVINADQKGIDGIGGLFSIQYRDMIAVVSEIALDKFQLHTTGADDEIDMDWIEQKASAHERIVEQLMKENDLLPAKFCSIVKNKEGVEAFLADNYPEYVRALQRLKGCEEWGVKAYLWPEKLKQFITENTPEIRERIEMLSFMSNTSTYLMKRKIDNLIHEQTDNRFDFIEEYIVKALRAVSECEASLKPVAPKLQQTEDRFFFNASFLVRKTMLQSFHQQLNELSDKFEPEGVTFKITGPWPPYTFVKDTEQEAVERSLVRLLLPLK